MRKVESKAAKINNYERTALHLSKENRELRRKINSLEYDIQQYRAKISYLKLKIDQQKGSRKVASIGPTPLFKKDLVQFATYKW
jgi:predicted RNase H-like nuclease (RuvC/YqgF family)